jgi:hypothetical protein
MESLEPKPGVSIKSVFDDLVGGVKSAGAQIPRVLATAIPLSLALALLQRSGIGSTLAAALEPLRSLFGLSLPAALIFCLSTFISTPSALVVMGLAALDLREATILSVMALFSHDLVREAGLMKKGGSSGAKLPFLRLLTALVSALALNVVLPGYLARLRFGARLDIAQLEFWPAMGAWGISLAKVAIAVSISLLIVRTAQRILEDFRVLELLSAFLGPFMKLVGLPAPWSAFWVSANVSGYEFCAAQLKGAISDGKLKPQEGDLFNHHAAFCHALLEDTVLFAMAGLSLFWIIIPRLAVALVFVWIERARRHFVRRSFRAGVA